MMKNIKSCWGKKMSPLEREGFRKFLREQPLERLQDVAVEVENVIKEKQK